MSRHPMQPVVIAEDGCHRFKENKIVTYLLDNGGVDLNQLAVIGFSNEDREQFAQLIGYSVSGTSTLEYVSDETYYNAMAQSEKLAQGG